MENREKLADIKDHYRNGQWEKIDIKWLIDQADSVNQMKAEVKYGIHSLKRIKFAPQEYAHKIVDEEMKVIKQVRSLHNTL